MLCVAIGAACAAPARADLLIAVAGPLVGREADRTAGMFEAANKAAAALNAAGGVNGEALTVERVDDGCARQTAAAAAEKLIARKSALVLGHPCAPAALAAAAVYGKSATLYIATETRHPSLTENRAGPTIFRLAGRDDRQGEMAGRLLARAGADEAVAIVHDRTQYARALAEQSMAAFKRDRAATPITATIIGGDLDYKRTVAKIKNASIIFFAGFPLEGGLIYSALREAGSTAQFIGSDSLATEEFATTFGAAAKGVRVLASSAARPGVQALSRHRDETEEAARVRASIEAYAAAAKVAQSNAPDKIATALGNGAFATSLGPISFAANGDALVPSYQLVEWLGDAWDAAADQR